MKSSTEEKISGNWKQMKGKIKERWGELTDDDLRKAEGRSDQLVGIIEERSGERRADIERRLDEMANEPTTQEHTTQERPSR